MDHTLNKEQTMLKSAAKEFLAKECPEEHVREMEENGKGYSPGIWRKMAELGWTGIIIPEKYGGLEMRFLDLAVLIEEMGKALLPGPFLPTVVYCAIPIIDWGTEEQKAEILPKIAGGEMIMTLALVEPSATFDANGVTAKAVADGDDYILNGVKIFSPYAHVADHLLVAARTRDAYDKEDGITLFLVDAKSPGLTCTVLSSIASDKQCEVALENVRVTKKNILGDTDKGWKIASRILEYAACAQCILMVGGGKAVLDKTVDYAKTRVQFDRPIGSFQAVQHTSANMLIDLDGSRYLSYQAAWKLSEGLPSTLEVSMAKAWTSDAFRRICAEAMQIYSGYGIMKEVDLQLYFRRAKAAEVAFGDGDTHREKVAHLITL